jgi:hypothetical protein
MILHTALKLKKMSLAQQVVAGAFINGALVALAAGFAARQAMKNRGGPRAD